MRFSPSVPLSALLMASPVYGVAEEQTGIPDAQSVVVLPDVSIDSHSLSADDRSFMPSAAPQVTKSSTPLSQTPQSVTVLTRSVLDSQQAQSLAEALHTVPGVVSGQFGRRGWDDLIIRGQVASDSLYLDGLRTAPANRVSEQIFGLEQIEVLKGPASVYYGLVMPGGVVNMVSKRPKPDAFANLGVSYGSHDLKQSTFDVGTPLSDNGRTALRINGLAMNANDATDHVWSRDRYIAPSLSLDLGEDRDFTILASHHERDYIRQQGLPLVGSVYSSPYGHVSRSLFTGEPGQRPYHATEDRIGYNFVQRFGDGWSFNQALRWMDYDTGGQLFSNGKVAADGRTMSRSATDQTWDGDTLNLDNNLQRTFTLGQTYHEVTLGTDYMRGREGIASRNCKVSTLDIFAPVYGGAINCPASPTSRTSTTIRMLGTYLRDSIQVGDRWNVVAGLRHDKTSTYGVNHINGERSDSPADDTTGTLAVMYELVPGVRPYVSYATSFYPNNGTDVSGRVFKPEEGEQWEAGVKYDMADLRTLLTFAVYDLRRKNVLQSDPANDGFSIAVGEQRTQGFEAEINSDITDKLSLIGGYSYTWAQVTDDGGKQPSTKGRRLNDVPTHTASLFARYRLNGTDKGWEVNSGVNAESDRYTNGFNIPGFATWNAGLAYDTEHWRAALNGNNLLNKHYYTGGKSNVVMLGDDRNFIMSLTYRL